MLNQGDFFQDFDSLLEAKPMDVTPYYAFGPAAFVWSYSNSDSKPLAERNSSWIYLWAQTRIQRLFSAQFSLRVMAFISKLILLACCWRLAVLLARDGWRLAVFAMLLLAVGCAHNCAFLNSFYGEHTFLVFLPVALVGLFEQRRWPRMILIPAGLLFAGAAKPQYFYLPALAAGVLVLFDLRGRRRVDVPLTALLLAAFGVSWFYAFHAGGNVANYYNSTYFGSYLPLSDEELRGLRVKPENLECVGVDPWGNRIDRGDTLKLSHGPANCAQRTAITLKTVLMPYFRHPLLLPEMWTWLAPAHFTVLYFHVYPNTPYIIPADGRSFYWGHLLVKLSELRQRLITPIYPVLILAGIALVFVRHRSVVSVEMKTVTLLLALFIPSQFAVSLLGEGVRDLSKHLAAAQFCLDLLCVLLIVQAAALISAWRSPDL